MLAKAYYQQIAEYCGYDKKAVHWNYTASIITPKGDQMVDSVLAIDIQKDYERGFTDHIVLDCAVLKSFYIDNLYPVRNNFRVNVVMTQLMEKESGIRLDKPMKITRQYKGVLVNPVDLGNNRKDASNTMSNEDQNRQTKFVSVKIQLVALPAEQIMKMSFGGLFHGTPADVCKAMLTEACSQLKGEAALSGVDMPCETDNKESIFDIVVPHGTKLVDLPRYIQEKCYGIYNHGIGSYIHDKHWFLYPIYDFTRYEKEDTRLTVSIVPPIAMLDNKRTYAINKRHVNIICAGDIDLTDHSRAKFINEGNGITYFDTSKMKQESVTKTPQGVIVNPTEAKKQMLVGQSEDGLDSAPMLAGRLTSSLANVASQIARRNSTVISLVWNYANPYLLVPGMATKVIYYKDNVRYEITGVLLKQVVLVHPEGKTMAMGRFNTSVGLVILIDRSQLKKIEDKQYGNHTKGNRGGLIDTLRRIRG